MGNDIFFSVIICCYNSEKFLKNTIESVINQTHKNWEIVIVDDGSIDKTEKIILDYQHSNIPLTYHKQPNKGYAVARNKAIELSKHDWIAIIDHDDICLPNRLEIQAKHICNNNDAKLFFANTIHFNNADVEIRRQFDHFNPCHLNLVKKDVFNYLFRYGCFIDTESVVFNKKAAISVGGFDQNYKYVADYDFFLRMGLSFDFFGGEELVSKWRVHKNQSSQTMKSTMFKESNKLFFKYYHYREITKGTRVKMIIQTMRRCLKNLLRISRIISG